MPALIDPLEWITDEEDDEQAEEELQRETERRAMEGGIQ